MPAAIPTSEPSALRAGDTWKWTRSLPDYPASAGWTLKYRFKNSTGGFEIVASASGNDYSITAAAVTTATYTAGTYTWEAWVEGGSSEKYTIDEGTFVVKPDYRAVAAGAALDDRSHAKKVLDAITAVIENRASKDQERYMIANRELWRTPIPELLKLRQRYLSEVNAEINAQKINDGLASGRKIQFRL